MLIARIRAESKASSVKELNIVISGKKKSESMEEVLVALSIDTQQGIEKIYKMGKTKKDQV